MIRGREIPSELGGRPVQPDARRESPHADLPEKDIPRPGAPHPSAPSSDTESPNPLDALRDDALRLLAEVQRVATSYKRLGKIALLRKSAHAQRAIDGALFGAAAGLVGLFALAVLVTLTLVGAAGAFAALFDAPFWTGALLVGALGLATVAALARALWRKRVHGRLDRIRSRLGVAE